MSSAQVSKRELSFTEKIKHKFIAPLRDVLKDIWRITPGKVAIVILLVLAITSVYAAVSMPEGFLTKWESPSYWEDNPVVAPPCWVQNLGYNVPESLVSYLNKPAQPPITGDNRVTLIYTYKYNLDADSLPQDVVVKVNATTVCIPTETGNMTQISPRATVIITRPDGINYTVFDFALPTTGCGNVTWKKTGKEDIKIADLVTVIIDKYNITVPPEIIGSNTTYWGVVANSVLRSVIRQIVESRYMSTQAIFTAPVPGSLVVSIDVNISKQNLLTIVENVRQAKTALSNYKGDFYVSMALSALNLTESNLTYALNLVEKGNATISDFGTAVENAMINLDKARNYLAFASIQVPSEVSTYLSNAGDLLKKIWGWLNSIGPIWDLNIATAPLKGDYNITVIVTYTGVSSLKPEEMPSVGVVIKGGCYGLLGTGAKGVDIAQILLYGTPIALLIGFIAAISTTLLGVFAGITSGYYGGFIDEFIQRTADIIGNIPMLPILIIIGSIAQKTFSGEWKSFQIILTYIAILVIFGWGGLAITVRAMTLSIKEEPYIEAARAMGASNRRIIFKHIFPQVMMYAVAVLVFNVPSAILTEAGLSVLGLRHGWPTWGSLLADARAELRYDVWWWIFPPGFMLSITSLAFVLLGLAIERIVEPRLRTL